MPSKLNIVSIVGARPSFVKMAPLAWEFKKQQRVNHTIIHTGQHYDEEMYSSFFDTLRIPQPDFDLGVGSGSHGKMTGDIMRELEQVLLSIDIDWVIVYGASNSSLAGALTAAKLGIKIMHIESGLRSGNRKHPEEINRRAAELVSDLLICTGEPARQNLLADGVDDARIKVFGNLMIDALVDFQPMIEKQREWETYDLKENEFFVTTLHQPYNVDDPERLGSLVDELLDIGGRLPILFPIHPRTSRRLEAFGLMERILGDQRVRLTPPLDYLHFLSLVKGSRGLITDSGGIADETTYFGVPCMSIRPTLERSITAQLGTNELVPLQKGALTEMIEKLLAGTWKRGEVPPYWDGHTNERIVAELLQYDA